MGGTKHDSEKPRLDLIPPEAEVEEALVWTFGAYKYEDYNWTKGIKYSRIIAAAMRHLNAIRSGQDLDPETQRMHAAHIRCCMAMLIWYSYHNKTELDDRLKQPKD